MEELKRVKAREWSWVCILKEAYLCILASMVLWSWWEGLPASIFVWTIFVLSAFLTVISVVEKAGRMICEHFFFEAGRLR